MQPFLRSKLFIYSAVILALLSITALWREVSGTIKTKKQIAQLQKEAADLETRNNQLKQLIDYLDSPEYKEKAAREQLNLQSPGEVAVALPDADTQVLAAQAQSGTDDNHESQTDDSNFSRWWNYFFALKNNNGR